MTEMPHRQQFSLKPLSYRRNQKQKTKKNVEWGYMEEKMAKMKQI